jgi:hypothetical protein
MLIELGYRDAFEYGWSLYLTLLDFVAERQTVKRA